ncbi:bifunctional alpha/beta hydrolase/class I SAM-dependent methyltransferase [Fontivita pretiosa]|uniref:bifunctional alpha/beta hydrolase/class I SAM-dependent methyltransferase n=1 Tax=Fontivita pretiosa TaxID=2989684 RepID=UPI003D16D024
MQTQPATVRQPTCLQRTFSTRDGAELFYRAWLPATPTHKALLLVHRGHEHSGRWQQFVHDLNLADLAIFACDLRGHGRSIGARGYADDFSDHARDLDAFVKHLGQQYDMPVQNIVAVGHSLGAVVLAAWVHDYAPPIRGMVLATPALRVKLYVPLALPALRALHAIKRRAFISSYVRATMLTHDAWQAEQYANDPLISRQIAVNVLLGLHDTSMRLIADAPAIRTPTLLLAASSDWVVNNSAIRQFHDRLGAADKSLHLLSGFRHAIFHEVNRQQPIALVRDFVRRVYQLDPPQRSSAGADPAEYTTAEFHRLQQPLPIWCPRRIHFAATKLCLRTVGRLSRGIRIGWEHGFDSGQSLDHVYTNRAQGLTPLGVLIDRIYLNAVGWRGIRVRRDHLQQLLRRAIELTLRTGPSARIVDIASGPGRYLLGTLADQPPDRVRALLRDRSEDGLGRARAIAMRLRLTNVEFQIGDAFDRQSLASIHPSPNIAVVSGLYELFDRNDMVLTSLKALAQAMRDGGYLIYTNQPWHPQIEMIARVLRDHRGRRWIMRRRTQQEMDALVRAAGFDKLDMLIDRWGIFSVSLARKI